MTEIGGEFGVAGAFAGAEQGQRDPAVWLRREQPVAGESDDERLGLDLGERLFQRTVGVGQIKLVQRTGDVEVGVRVEAVDEALRLVAQVAFHLEMGVEPVFAR